MLSLQCGKNRVFLRVIALVIVQAFFFTSLVYPAPSDRSFFKNKKVDYKKIQGQREEVLQQKKDTLSGKTKAKKSIYTQDKRDLAHRIKLSSLKDLSSIYIPDSLGRVVEVYQATGDPSTSLGAGKRQETSPLVVHIQDLHTNAEAQFNEAGILEILIKDYGLSLVCSEGAEGEVDTSSVSSFPDPEVREKTARLFVDSGELTAEEYLSITKYPDLPIWGIEDKDIYFQNIIEFNKIMKFSPDAQVFIQQAKEALEGMKSEIYSKRLLEIDAKQTEYEEGELDTNEYLDYLYRLSESRTIRYRNIDLLRETLEFEKGIDQQKIMEESQRLLVNLQEILSEKGSKYETEILLAKASLFKDQKISPFSFYSYLEELARRHLKDDLERYQDLLDFVAYLEKVNSLDSMKLFQEIEELTYETKDILSTNENQKLLTRSLRHIKFLENFFNLKVSNEELDYYLANRDGFKVNWFKSVITNLTNSTNLTDYIDYNPDLIDMRLPELEHFYEIARERDIAMIDNAVSEIEKRGIKVAALVSGGFHTRGITQLLKEKGYSYVVISPYSSTDIDEENYHFLLSGKRRPISALIKELNNQLRTVLFWASKETVDAYNRDYVPKLARILKKDEKELLLPYGTERMIPVLVPQILALHKALGPAQIYATFMGWPLEKLFIRGVDLQILMSEQKDSLVSRYKEGGEYKYLRGDTEGNINFASIDEFRGIKIFGISPEGDVTRGNINNFDKDQVKRLLAKISRRLEGYHYSEAISKYLIEKKAEVRYLPTDKITSKDLGYLVALREMQLPLKKLPPSFDQISDINVNFTKETIFLISKVHSGDEGIVRIGFLDDDRPVAVKTYYTEEASEKAKEEYLLEDFHGAILADQLGIGPRFHGKHIDHEGKINLVMDIVPGDFLPASKGFIAVDTIRDFREINKRLTRINKKISMASDFQYYITPEGRIQIIDQRSLVTAQQLDSLDILPYIIESSYLYTLSWLLNLARESVREEALKDIRDNEPDTFASLKTYLEKYRKYIDFVRLRESITAVSQLAQKSSRETQPRKSDGKFDEKEGGNWQDVLSMIADTPELRRLAEKGKLTIKAYREAYGRITQPAERVHTRTTSRDFHNLVNKGYLTIDDTSKKEYTYQLTEEGKRIMASEGYDILRIIESRASITTKSTKKTRLYEEIYFYSNKDLTDEMKDRLIKALARFPGFAETNLKEVIKDGLKQGEPLPYLLIFDKNNKPLGIFDCSYHKKEVIYKKDKDHIDLYIPEGVNLYPIDLDPRSHTTYPELESDLFMIALESAVKENSAFNVDLDEAKSKNLFEILKSYGEIIDRKKIQEKTGIDNQVILATAEHIAISPGEAKRLYERMIAGDPDRRFVGERPARWKSVFDTIARSPRLLNLAIEGRLRIKDYREVDKSHTYKMNRADFLKLVEMGYMSKEGHIYKLTEEGKRLSPETFASRIRSMKEYPVVRFSSLEQAEAYAKTNYVVILKKIAAILKRIEHPVVFVFDLDGTLSFKDDEGVVNFRFDGYPKTKYFKELLDVLRISNHIVGMATSRSVIIDKLESDKEKDFIKGFTESERYREIKQELVALGVKIDDFDFFVTGVLIGEGGLILKGEEREYVLHYIRVKNRWSDDREEAFESIKPMEPKDLVKEQWKNQKFSLLSSVNDAFINRYGLNIFQGASIFTIDDDLLKGQSLMHMYPYIIEHAGEVTNFLSQVEDVEEIEKVLKGIRKTTGVVVPRITTLKDIIDTKKVKENRNLLLFDQCEGSKIFNLPKVDSEKDILYFDLAGAILKQLEALEASGDAKIVLPMGIPELVIERYKKKEMDNLVLTPEDWLKGKTPAGYYRAAELISIARFLQIDYISVLRRDRYFKWDEYIDKGVRIGLTRGEVKKVTEMAKIIIEKLIPAVKNAINILIENTRPSEYIKRLVEIADVSPLAATIVVENILSRFTPDTDYSSIEVTHLAMVLDKIIMSYPYARTLVIDAIVERKSSEVDSKVVNYLEKSLDRIASTVPQTASLIQQTDRVYSILKEAKKLTKDKDIKQSIKPLFVAKAPIPLSVDEENGEPRIVMLGALLAEASLEAEDWIALFLHEIIHIERNDKDKLQKIIKEIEESDYSEEVIKEAEKRVRDIEFAVDMLTAERLIAHGRDPRAVIRLLEKIGPIHDRLVQKGYLELSDDLGSLETPAIKERVKNLEVMIELVESHHEIGKKFGPTGHIIDGGMSKGRIPREIIVVDWDRDLKLRKLYKDILKKANITEQDKELSGTKKGGLLYRIFGAVRDAIEDNEFVESHKAGNVILVGDTIKTGGVCRHKGPVTAAIIERMIKTGILKGKVYYIRGWEHAWAVYRTSGGEFVVFDTAIEEKGYFGDMDVFYNGAIGLTYKDDMPQEILNEKIIDRDLAPEFETVVIEKKGKEDLVLTVEDWSDGRRPEGYMRTTPMKLKVKGLGINVQEVVQIDWSEWAVLKAKAKTEGLTEFEAKRIVELSKGIVQGLEDAIRTKDNLHASWAHVEKLSPENYHKSRMIMPGGYTVVLSLINRLRKHKEANEAAIGKTIELEGLEGHKFKVTETQGQRILVSKDIIDTMSDGETMALLSNALSAIGFGKTKDGLPLIISSLFKSPRFFEDCKENGFIGINQTFLELYRNNPLQKEYLKILLQVGLEHELRHEKGVTDELELTKIDAKRILDLCAPNSINAASFMKLLKDNSIIDEQFERIVQVMVALEDNLSDLRAKWKSSPNFFISLSSVADQKEKGIKWIIKRMQNDRGCYIGFGDMTKIGVMNYVFTKQIVDRLIPIMVNAANIVLEKYKGGAVRIGGDEVGLVLPSNLTPEEVNNIRLELQTSLASFLADYGFVKVKGVTDKNIEDINKTLVTDGLTGIYKDRDGFFMVFDKTKPLIDKVEMDGTPVDIPSPRLTFGIVKASTKSRKVHANYGISIRHAEYVRNIANENGWHGATSEALGELDRFDEEKEKPTIPKLSIENRRKIAKEYSEKGIKLYYDQIEEYYPIVKREYLHGVIQKMRKAFIGTTVLVRGPPDNFYIVTKTDDSSISLMKLELVYEPHGKLKREVDKAIKDGRFTAEDLREKWLNGYGLKVINQFYDHGTANKVILTEAELLNDIDFSGPNLEKIADKISGRISSEIEIEAEVKVILSAIQVDTQKILEGLIDDIDDLGKITEKITKDIPISKTSHGNIVKVFDESKRMAFETARKKQRDQERKKFQRILYDAYREPVLNEKDLATFQKGERRLSASEVFNDDSMSIYEKIKRLEDEACGENIDKGLEALGVLKEGLYRDRITRQLTVEALVRIASKEETKQEIACKAIELLRDAFSIDNLPEVNELISKGIGQIVSSRSLRPVVAQVAFEAYLKTYNYSTLLSLEKKIDWDRLIKLKQEGPLGLTEENLDYFIVGEIAVVLGMKEGERELLSKIVRDYDVIEEGIEKGAKDLKDHTDQYRAHYVDENKIVRIRRLIEESRKTLEEKQVDFSKEEMKRISIVFERIEMLIKKPSGVTKSSKEVAPSIEEAGFLAFNAKLDSLLASLKSNKNPFRLDTLATSFKELESNLALSNPSLFNVFKSRIDALSRETRIKIANYIERFKEKDVDLPNLSDIFHIEDSEILSVRQKWDFFEITGPEKKKVVDKLKRHLSPINFFRTNYKADFSDISIVRDKNGANYIALESLEGSGKTKDDIKREILAYRLGKGRVPLAEIKIVRVGNVDASATLSRVVTDYIGDNKSFREFQKGSIESLIVFYTFIRDVDHRFGRVNSLWKDAGRNISISFDHGLGFDSMPGREVYDIGDFINHCQWCSIFNNYKIDHDLLRDKVAEFMSISDDEIKKNVYVAGFDYLDTPKIIKALIEWRDDLAMDLQEVIRLRGRLEVDLSPKKANIKASSIAEAEDEVLLNLAERLASPIEAGDFSAFAAELKDILSEEAMRKLFDMIQERRQMTSFDEDITKSYYYIGSNPREKTCLLRGNSGDFIESVKRDYFSAMNKENGMLFFAHEIEKLEAVKGDDDKHIFFSDGYVFIMTVDKFNELSNIGRARHEEASGDWFVVSDKIEISKENTPIIFITKELKRLLTGADKEIREKIKVLQDSDVEIIVIPDKGNQYNMIRKVLTERNFRLLEEDIPPSNATVIYNVLRHPAMKGITREILTRL